MAADIVLLITQSEQLIWNAKPKSLFKMEFYINQARAFLINSDQARVFLMNSGSPDYILTSNSWYHPSWSAALFHPQGLTIWPTGALIHSPHNHWRGIIIVPLFPRWKPCHLSNPHYTRNYLDTPHPSWSTALFYPQELIICPTGAINDPSLLLTPVVLRSQLCFSLAIYIITDPSLLLVQIHQWIGLINC